MTDQVKKIFKEQDEQLELLLQSVKNQKLIAQTINSELELQNKILSDTQDRVEITQDKLTMAKKKVDKIVEKDRWFSWFKW
jgi:hypothetical protein